MLAALLLAAGAAATPHGSSRSLDQRVSLLEARQMLESQSLWGLQSVLHPDALRAVADVELHVAQDRERDEALRTMTEKVALLEQRLAALEAVLGDRVVVEGALRVQPQPAQIGEPQIRVKPAPAPVAKAQKTKGPRARKQAQEQASPLAAPRYADAKR